MLNVIGSRLKSDRKSKRLSVESLSIETNLSVRTIQRAEAGVATETTLETLAKYFNQNIGRYLEKSDRLNTESSEEILVGTWTVYYFEKEVGSKPYLVTDKLNIEVTNRELFGVFSPKNTDNPDNYLGTAQFLLTGKSVGDSFFGEYNRREEDSRYPQGLGVFHLKMSRSNSWLEGFLTFYSDSGTISLSHTIWVKDRTDESSNLCAAAKRFLFSNVFYFESPLSS